MSRYLTDISEDLLAQPLDLPHGFRFLEAGPVWYAPADGGHGTRTVLVEDDGAPMSLEGCKVCVWLEKDYATGEVRVSSRELVAVSGPED